MTETIDVKTIVMESKIQICGNSYPTKENRMDVIYTIVHAMKDMGYTKEKAKTSLKLAMEEFLGPMKKVNKDTREFIVSETQKAFQLAFVDVFGVTVQVHKAPEELKKPVEYKPTKVNTNESRELERFQYEQFDADAFEDKKNRTLGPKMEDVFDSEFADFLGINKKDFT